MLVLGIKEKSMAWHRVCQDDTHGLVFKTKLQTKLCHFLYSKVHMKVQVLVHLLLSITG